MPNPESSCPSSTTETTMSPSTSDEQMEKKVTNCSDAGEKSPTKVDATNDICTTQTLDDRNDGKQCSNPETDSMHQQPSSSTEERSNNCLTSNNSGSSNSTEHNDVSMEIEAGVSGTTSGGAEPEKEAPSAIDSKANMESIDCAVDSSGDINKCDSAIIDDTTETETQATIVSCENASDEQIKLSNTSAGQTQKGSEIEQNVASDSNDSGNNGNSIEQTSEAMQTDDISSELSSSNVASDKANCLNEDASCSNGSNAKNVTDLEVAVVEAKEHAADGEKVMEKSGDVDDKNDEHCDSAESLEKNGFEQLVCTKNDAIAASDVDCEAAATTTTTEAETATTNTALTTDQLDSKIEQIEKLENNDSVDERQQTTENGSNDCDSSDILVENPIDGELKENGAISVNYTKQSATETMSSTCETNTTERTNDVVNSPETIHSDRTESKRIENKVDEENKNEQQKDSGTESKAEIVQEVVAAPCQTNAVDERKSPPPLNASAEVNDVQEQMDVDQETNVNDADDQSAKESASSSCAPSGESDCTVSTPSESHSNSNANASVNVNVDESSEKQTKCTYDVNEFVSSPEIAPIGFKDKFKKSFEIMEKSKQESNLLERLERTQGKQTNSSDVNADSVQCDENSTSNADSSNRKSPIVSAPASNASANQHSGDSSSSIVCDLTVDDDKITENVKRNSEPMTNCNSIKEKLKRHDFNILDGKSSAHSSLLKQQHQNRQISADSQNQIVTPSAATETRTIIISPNSRARLEPASNVQSSDSSSLKCGSLYVSNPDFSKSLRPSLRDLSELKMKPPDFTKIRSSELHVPNPDFTKAYDKAQDGQSRSPIPLDINPNNFAEISKKYNYISDLQLKNPLPTTSKSNEPTQSTCASLYVKPPDFTNSKLRNQIENDSDVSIEEPTPHIIHKNMYRSSADSSSKSNTASASTSRPTSIHADYPQISEDVTMSLVQHGPQTPKTQQQQQPPPSKSSATAKPLIPEHRNDARPNAAPSPQIYSPTPNNDRRISPNYYPHPMHSMEKSLPTIRKIYNDEMYQRNASTSPVPVAVRNSYESYTPIMEKPALPKGNTNHSPMEMNASRPLPNESTQQYSRPPSATSHLYSQEQSNRLKPIHSAQDVMPSSSNHINTYNYAAGRPASAHGFAPKTNDYYNQMNLPQKWPSQTRITQSPISSAPSPHSLNSSNVSISQSHSPASASPLPYQMHRQSPSNMQYQSPHTTPSPSPFSYSPGPMPVKLNKLPANAPINNIPSQSGFNILLLSFPFCVVSIIH